MTFNTHRAAIAYAKSLTADMRGIHKHKAVAANQWCFNRITGEYYLAPCWTITLIKVA